MGKRKSASPIDSVDEEASPAPKKTTKKKTADTKKKSNAPVSDEPYISTNHGWNVYPPAVLHKNFGDGSGTKIAAFDLDDTLVKLKSSARFPTTAEDFKLFNKKVPEVLQDFASEGYRLIIFSNQGGIKSALEGLMAEKLTMRASNIVAQLDVPVHVFYATADDKSEKDKFRKPKPGLWQLMVDTVLRSKSPRLSDCFFVGDAAGRDSDFADSDKKFAEAVGIAFKTPEEVFGDSDSKKVLNTDKKGENHNQALSDAFQQLAQLSESQGGNAFGIRALQKVAGILAAFPKKITSTAEVKNVAGVGKASIQKIEEFLATGKLHQLEEAGIKVEPASTGEESAAFKFL